MRRRREGEEEYKEKEKRRRSEGKREARERGIIELVNFMHLHVSVFILINTLAYPPPPPPSPRKSAKGSRLVKSQCICCPQSSKTVFFHTFFVFEIQALGSILASCDTVVSEIRNPKNPHFRPSFIYNIKLSSTYNDYVAIICLYKIKTHGEHNMMRVNVTRGGIHKEKKSIG